jgi:hypothetical protein
VWTPHTYSTLLLGTAIAYMWDLSASGYANSFYAAAGVSCAMRRKSYSHSAPMSIISSTDDD